MNNIKSFGMMKKKGTKIAMVTAYDYPSGKFCELADIDLILVGDSLGMVVLGYETTINVTLADMIHHCKAVRRGALKTFIIADMPFMSYHISQAETKKNAALLIREGGANAVKLEGGSPERLEMIRAIVRCDIPVVGHLGITPQSINTMGGYFVQGKDEQQAKMIIEQAIEIEKAGAFMMVLEGIPEKLGKEITGRVNIPTIGIGAGKYTDGQVLVYHDLLGYYEFIPKFVKKYAQVGPIIISSIKNYKNEVKENKFPEQKNIYFAIDKR